GSGSQEFAGAPADGRGGGQIRTIERNLCRALIANAKRRIERLAPPTIVGLVSRETHLGQQIGASLIVAHGRDDVTLLVILITGEFSQVRAAGPIGGIVRIGGDVERKRISPVAINQYGYRIKLE